MSLTLPQIVPGLSAGLALGGAWLTSLAFLRSDQQIRDEETTWMDGGVTRVSSAMESARVGRLGVCCTALAIVFAGTIQPSSSTVSVHATAIIAAATVVAVRAMGWTRSYVFRHIERPPEFVAAEKRREMPKEGA